MGLKLGRLFKKAAPFIGAAAGGFFGGPAGAQAGFRVGAALRPTSRAAAFAGVGGGVGAGVPSIEALTGVPSFLPAMVQQPVVQRNGGVIVPAAGAVAVGISRAVVSAVLRLAAAMGVLVTAGNFRRVALRLWRAVTGLARRHPGISILAFLTGLGLAADEAAEFLFWGQQLQRRRRGRGISARDIRICRRTIRKMSAFRRDLGGFGVARRAGGRRALRGGGGVVIAQQD